VDATEIETTLAERGKCQVVGKRSQAFVHLASTPAVQVAGATPLLIHDRISDGFRIALREPNITTSIGWPRVEVNGHTLTMRPSSPWWNTVLPTILRAWEIVVFMSPR
jgi:hypothetical protein